jgi:hypothetical protein
LFDAVLGWQTVSTTLENTPELGINATADPTNRLSVSAPATLLNHEGAGHQLKINKATCERHIKPFVPNKLFWACGNGLGRE